MVSFSYFIFFLRSSCEMHPQEAPGNKSPKGKASSWQQGPACPAVGWSPRSKGALWIALVVQTAGGAAWGFPGGHQSQERRKIITFTQSSFLLADISVALLMS